MIFFHVIICIFALLILIAAVRAVVIKKEYNSPKPFDMKSECTDYNTYAENLSRIIQIPTISIRGVSDNTNIYKLHELFAELYPYIYKQCTVTDIDGALLYKLSGTNEKLQPILLMSHQDVVEATGKWHHEPFSGEIKDNKIWGRGTVDTKGSLCAMLEAMNELIRDGFIPERDMYIASSNNEEITGDGAIKTVEYLYERGITFELVMDEGGSVLATEAGQALVPHNAMVGVFEKGRANIKFIANSSGGHASVPFNKNPFARLAKLVYIIENRNPFKKRITRPVILQYKAMAPYMKHFRHRFLYGNLWLFRFFPAPQIMHKQGGQTGAMVKTTCVFTMAEGSKGANVIPEQATLTANCRFMIHEPLKPSYAKLARLADKLELKMEMITGFDVPPLADMESYAYKYVNHRIQESFGDIPRIPYIMLAGTDARHYTKICDCVLRFVPLMMTARQLNSAHAVDENINVEALARAVRFYYDFMKNYGEPTY